MKRVILFLLIPGLLFSQKIDYKEFTERVLKDNPGIHQIESEKRAAILDVKKATARFFPKIDFTGSYTYLQNPMDPIYLYTSDLEGIIPGFSSSSSMDRIMIMDSPEPNYFDFGLKIVQPIFTWGKLTNGKKIYEELSLLKTTQGMELESELRSKVKAYYYTLSILNMIEEEIVKQEKAGVKLRELSKNNYDNGFIEYSTYLEIEYLFIDLERARNDIKYQIKSVVNSLRYLINSEDIELDDLNLNIDLDPFKVNIPKDDTYITKAINGNPVLLTLEQLRSVKKLEVEVAKSSRSYLPDLAFQVDLNYSGSRFPFVEKDWYRQNDYGLNLTFAITSNIFDGGYSGSDLKNKESIYNSVGYQLDSARNSLKEEAYKRIYSLEELKLKLDNLSRRKRLTGDKKDLSEIKYKQGLILETELLEDEIEFYTDEINYLSELLNFYLDYIALESILNLGS